MSDIHIAKEGMESGARVLQPHHPFIWIAAILIPVCSAWRLAKFNLDTRQTSGFLGLPTPANALFWASYALLASNNADLPVGSKEVTTLLFFALNEPLVVFILALLLSILMLSEIPLPSLKFKHFHWKGNEIVFLLLGFGLLLVLLYGMLAVPLIMLLYLLSPLWGRLFRSS